VTSECPPKTLSTVVDSPATIAATSTTYIALSFFVVAMNTGPVVRRRYIKIKIPTSMQTPARVPHNSALK